MKWNILILMFLFFSCSNESNVHSPKPHMYPRVNFPEKSYISFNREECPFTFEYPDYAENKMSQKFFDEDPTHPCWFDMNIDTLNSQIHFSYYPITGEKSFDQLVNDAFKLVEKHNIKAFYREETEISSGNVSGLMFEIQGPVASPVQFFLTDSTQHFVRASLYFNDKVDADSLAPIIQFVKMDLDHVISTFEWK